MRGVLLFLWLFSFMSGNVFGCDFSDKLSALGAAPDSGQYKIVEKNTRGFISAVVVVSKGILRKDVKPTILSAIRTLKHKYPDYLRITVDLVPEDEALAEMGIHAGVAEYLENNKKCSASIKIEYGVPSERQVKHYNAKIGKPIKGTADDKSPVINNNIPLAIPDDKSFDASQAGGIIG